jgi:hypothetical protein
MQWLGFVAAILGALAGVAAAGLVDIIWRQGSRENYQITAQSRETPVTAPSPAARLDDANAGQSIDLRSQHL